MSPDKEYQKRIGKVTKLVIKAGKALDRFEKTNNGEKYHSEIDAITKELDENNRAIDEILKVIDSKKR